MVVFVGLIVIGVIVFLVYLTSWLYVVPHGHALVVEHLGQYSRVAYPGLHLLGPFEQARSFEWTMTHEGPKSGQYTRETQRGPLIRTLPSNYDFPEVKCISRDNVSLRVNGSMNYRITDPKQALYSTNNLYICLEQAHRSVVSDTMVQLPADAIVTSGLEGMASTLLGKLKQKVEGFGLDISSYFLEYISPSDIIVRANEEALAQKRCTDAEIAKQTAEAKLEKMKVDHQTEIALKKAEARNARRIARAETEAKTMLAQAKARRECEAQRAAAQSAHITAIVQAAKAGAGDQPLSQKTLDNLLRIWSDQNMASTLASSQNVTMVPHGMTFGVPVSSFPGLSEKGGRSLSPTQDDF